ncbi:MAG: response regulator transcription factor [Kiritimatiellae bacterium]|nr:response regulator transcription factor [Kiritimatiellia bacterium]
MDSRADNFPVIRVLIVDDNPTVRAAVALILEDENDLSTCGEACDIADALKQCEALQPDLALVDLSLRGEDGLDLVKRFRLCAPSMRLVVFSLHDEPFHIDGAREAGAHGYVIKSEDPQYVLDCMRRVMAGENRFPQRSLQ